MIMPNYCCSIHAGVRTVIRPPEVKWRGGCLSLLDRALTAGRLTAYRGAVNDTIDAGWCPARTTHIRLHGRALLLMLGILPSYRFNVVVRSSNHGSVRDNPRDVGIR